MKMKHYIFLVGLIVYLIQLQFKWHHQYLPHWINDYLADLLCIPLLLSTTLFVLRRIKKSPQLNLTPAMIFFTCAYVSFAFEFLLPRISTRYTSDILDVVAYFVGGFGYYIVPIIYHKYSNHIANKQIGF